jgi:exodeoxyribonuclease VII small subunit
MNAEKASRKSTKQAEEMPFEEALARLETIVTEMEQGEQALDESMKKFEEGMKLARFCTQKLGQTEKKIELLLRDGAEPEWQPFEEAAADTPELDFGNDPK